MPTFTIVEPESVPLAALPSTLLHAALIVGAIWASRAAVAGITQVPIEVSIRWPVQATTNPAVTTTSSTLPGIPVVGVPAFPDLPTIDPFAPIPGTTVDPRQLVTDPVPGTSILPGGDPGPTIGIFRDTEVDELPSLISAGRLRYPAVLSELSIDGAVTLSFVIDAEGRVELDGIEVISATHVGFVPAAQEAVTTSRFRPARKDGHAVRVRVRQTVTFRRGWDAGCGMGDAGCGRKMGPS